MIIDPENWFLKSNFGTFWYIPTTPILKIQWFPVGMYIFMEKNLVLYPRTWNFITSITILVGLTMEA